MPTTSSDLRRSEVLLERRVRIIDTFTFHNEFDILRARFAVLRNHVDAFVIAEASQTHSGEPRALVLTPQLIASLGGTNVYIEQVMDMPLGADNWAREHHQRRSILRGLEAIGAEAGDIIVLTDADEIPDPAVLRKLDHQLGSDPVELTMRLFQYRLNLAIDTAWPLARAVRFHQGIDLQAVREQINLARVVNSGWHFTYLGDTARAKQKLADFAHQELADVYDSSRHIDRCFRLHVDIQGRFPIKVAATHSLPSEVVSLFADRPDLWATMPSDFDRLRARLYQLSTRHRPRLGQQFCDDHPVIAAVVAAVVELFTKLRRSLPKVGK